MLKTTRYIRWTRALSTINRASLKLRKYVLIKKWKVAVTTSILYQKIVGSMPERNPSNNICSSHIQWSFIQQKAHLCLPLCNLDNTINKPSSAWESFNIRQKLSVFVFEVTHISNLSTVCLNLMRVGELVYHSGVKTWHMKYQFILNSNLILTKKY